MLPAAAVESLQTLARTLSAPGAIDALLAYWRGEQRDDLSVEVRAAADTLDRALPPVTRASKGVADLAERFSTPSGVLLLAWGAANAARPDLRLAPLLTAAASQGAHPNLVPTVARARLLEGPLADALACAPYAGEGAWLAKPAFAQARARLDILFWEAGACALQLPDLGPWLWGSDAVFDALVGRPAHGTLRGRVLAARCLEACARGIPTTRSDAVGKTLQTLQPLLLHPEPMVWVHAARAVGLLAGVIDALEGTLLDWMRSDSLLLRQRAVTAFASQGAARLDVLGGELAAVISDPSGDGVILGAVAAATPYLLNDRRDLWDKLATRVLSGDGGATAARALARGLMTVWRRGAQRALVEPALRRLRETARRAHGAGVEEWKRWIDVLSLTDALDGAERDPLDLELGLENLARLAAQYDDEEADARAARFALTLGPTFDEARRAALTETSPRRRAAAVNAAEGLARSLALALWEPLLATSPNASPVSAPDLSATWERFAQSPEVLLDEVAAHRQAQTLTPDALASLEVLAIRLGSYALDACDDDARRGPTAHRTCRWLRKVDGLVDGSRSLSPGLRAALAGLLWRLVDTTRGTALGELEDLPWIGPFAAWWALVIDSPAVLRALAGALPMADVAAIERAVTLADALRAAVSVGARRDWGNAREALTGLHAQSTELAQALVSLGESLGRFDLAAGPRADLDALCLDLALAAERLSAALADPVKALHPPPAEGFSSENAPRVAAQVARAIRHRETAPLAVWFEAIGPVTAALVESSVSAAVKRTPPPPPAPKKAAPRVIEGYELVRPLGEGGVGTVWLVRKPGADRLFVLKIPKADALADANEKEREAILASFVDEASALAGLYHPNVASIIDRGVSGGVPYLVLEYLIGADLKAYSAARRMSVFELRSVVLDACAGLAALHAAGLVHRDVKPANLWLRLPLAQGEVFDPEKHRDPARAHPLSTVVIDFGMVRASKASPEAVGRFVAGTPGYMAPEQVLDPVELDGRADVYALAGTVYNALTGRAFFDELNTTQERVIAHMKRDPLEDPERVKDLPAGLEKLLRAATAHDPKDRPHPMDFAREFAATFG